MRLRKFHNAFTLVEMLIVIAIISILAAMAISNFSNAAQDSREVLVRQHLAVFQEAAHTWANKEIGRMNGTSMGTVSSAMAQYNGAKTASERLRLFSDYLDEFVKKPLSTENPNGLLVDDSAGTLTTDAMRQTGYYLTLPAWEENSYPKVQLNQK